MRWLFAQITPARIAAFQAWRKQPTTVGGLAVITATLTAYGDGQLNWQRAAALLIGGLIMAVLNDNTSPPQAPLFLIKTGK